MKLFNLNKNYNIVCDTRSTRYGFKHEATLLYNGYEREFNKACYYNRTWEAFTYQTVIEGLICKSKELTDKEKKSFIKKINNNK